MTPAEQAQLVVALEVMAKDEAEIDRQRLVIAALVEALDEARRSAAIECPHHYRNHKTANGLDSACYLFAGTLAQLARADAALKLATDSDPRNEVAS